MSFDEDDYQVINKTLCSEAIKVLDSTDQDEDNKLNVDKLTKIGKECIEFSKAQWLCFSFKSNESITCAFFLPLPFFDKNLNKSLINKKKFT